MNCIEKKENLLTHFTIRSIILSNKLIFSALVSIFFSFLYFYFIVNQRSQNFFSVSTPRLLAFFGFFFFIVGISSCVFPELKKLSYRIYFFSLSSSIFSLFLSNFFSNFISANADMYLHYISRFLFDLLLYLTTCSILQIELREKRIFKNLFYLHIFAVILILVFFPLSYITIFNRFININTPIFITKHLLFPIKFIPYFFGIYFTIKKIKNSANVIFIPLLVSYIIGLIGQTYDELMYFNIIKKSVYSVLYYPYVFLFVFIFIIYNYNKIIYKNIKNYKNTYDEISGFMFHEAKKYLCVLYDSFYILNNTDCLLPHEEKAKNESNFITSFEIISHYANTIKDIKDTYDLIKPTLFDVIKCIKMSIDFIEIREKIVVNFEIFSQCEEIFVFSDRKKFIISIENVIQNAINYSHKNSSLLIKISYRDNQKSISIDFENDACIDANSIPFLFDAGFSSDSTKLNSGFGLAISRKAIESIGGTLQLKKHDRPVIFNFVIPISISEEVKEI